MDKVTRCIFKRWRSEAEIWGGGGKKEMYDSQEGVRLISRSTGITVANTVKRTQSDIGGYPPCPPNYREPFRREKGERQANPHGLSAGRYESVTTKIGRGKGHKGSHKIPSSLKIILGNGGNVETPKLIKEEFVRERAYVSSKTRY